MKKKKAHRKSKARRQGASRSVVSGWLDKKHRPVHGFALGALMVLFQSVWGVLALVGGVLMVISALAFVTGKMKK